MPSSRRKYQKNQSPKKQMFRKSIYMQLKMEKTNNRFRKEHHSKLTLINSQYKYWARSHQLISNLNLHKFKWLKLTLN